MALLAAGVASCGGGSSETTSDFTVQVVNANFPSRQELAQNTNLTLSVANTGDRAIPDLAITIFTSSNAAERSGASTQSSGTGTGESSTVVTDAASGEVITVTRTGSTQTGDLPTAQGSFSIRSTEPNLANPSRPVWILSEGWPKLAGETQPAGAESANTDTYTFGQLDAHQTLSAVWNVTPVQPGTYTVHYRVAADLQGDAKATTVDGSIPEGEFVVRISSAPPQSKVNEAGNVVPVNPYGE